MKNRKKIVPGSMAWEQICEQCGLCCLAKYCDDNGNFYLTRVVCDNLNLRTGKCNCYVSDYKNRGNPGNGCVAHGGGRLTPKTIKQDYLVPGFCPYVKKFVGPNNLIRPDMSDVELISDAERELPLSEYVIAGSQKFFRYNPHVNQIMADFWQKQK